MAIKFKRNNKGFDELRLSYSGMVKEHADKIEAAANAIPSTTLPAATEPYYETVEDDTPHRARYRVRTTSLRAVRHEAKTDALLRAMSSDG